MEAGQYTQNTKRILFAIVFAIVAVSCKPYESDNYINEENNAIADLIERMVEADYLLKHNDFGSNRPTIYLIDELYSELKLAEYDSISEKELEELSPLTKGKIKSRKIPDSLGKKIKRLNIKLLTIAEYENKHTKSFTESFLNGGLMGYLSISRIVFTDNFKRGYLSFDFYCGEGCAWNSVIEIQKIDGHWTESKFICGGIA